MPRLRQVSRAETTSEHVRKTYDLLFGDRDPVAEPGTATGTRGDWWTVFALVPDILEHANRGFALYRNPERRLDPQLRELGQTRVGWVKGSQFVFSQHCKSMRGLKMPEEKIAAIPDWQVADCFDDRERAVLAYADCLAAGGRTPQGVFDKLRTFLSDEEIMEFTYITCLYDMHAVMSRALRLEFDDRDDPIVEVPAPESFSARDFLDTGRR
ncbi:carboxymuconolactone decarboxylase family protein [Phenylobacterium sp.]|uniref:carboxymuconolactone decarboxylase family protein n=1 Tax=Phenylobacterium sp. TaxID=1871053 RepID=UPI0025F97067|nr:carboxymuconolactone decarboxylase family protein [Phenylobacterium sp.]MBX3483769.1 carboxymuconolactone decarboxylase family protein [Phenylobacterium sp.]MCW5760261.1 carboxymuconolactone decarboxylase family protein [Phenylobacterium sp.]